MRPGPQPCVQSPVLRERAPAHHAGSLAPGQALAGPAVQWVRLYGVPPEVPGCFRLLGPQTRRRVGVRCGGSWLGSGDRPRNADGDHEQHSKLGTARSGGLGPDEGGLPGGKSQEDSRPLTHPTSLWPPKPGASEGPNSRAPPRRLPRRRCQPRFPWQRGGASPPEAPPPAG